MSSAPRCPKCKSDRTRIFDRMGILRWAKCSACAYCWKFRTRRGW